MRSRAFGHICWANTVHAMAICLCHFATGGRVFTYFWLRHFAPPQPLNIFNNLAILPRPTKWFRLLTPFSLYALVILQWSSHEAITRNHIESNIHKSIVATQRTTFRKTNRVQMKIRYTSKAYRDPTSNLLNSFQLRHFGTPSSVGIERLVWFHHIAPPSTKNKQCYDCLPHNEKPSKKQVFCGEKNWEGTYVAVQRSPRIESLGGRLEATLGRTKFCKKHNAGLRKPQTHFRNSTSFSIIKTQTTTHLS